MSVVKYTRPTVRVRVGLYKTKRRKKMIRIHTSEIREACARLRAGDKVLLSGTVYTARDAAHKKIFKIFIKHLKNICWIIDKMYIINLDYC